MKISEIIQNYRHNNDMSQRELARRCDLSNTYISFLEKEVNPKTGQEIEITLTQYKKLADGMGISINTLFEMLGDDAPVSLAMPADELSDDEHRFLSAYRAADDRARVDALKTLLDHQRKKDTSQSAI